jgi:hypothetical protein
MDNIVYQMNVSYSYPMKTRLINIDLIEKKYLLFKFFHFEQRNVFFFVLMMTLIESTIANNCNKSILE